MTVPTDGHPEDRLSAYLDDELDLPERDAVDRHLVRCERCRDELASLRRLARGIADERIPDVPADLAGRVGRAIDAASVVRLPRRRYAVPATIAATIAAVGILIAVRWQGGRLAAPEPPSHRPLMTIPAAPPSEPTSKAEARRASPPSEPEVQLHEEAKQKAAEVVTAPAPRRAAADEKDREDFALSREGREGEAQANAPVDAMKKNVEPAGVAGGASAPAPAPAVAPARAKSDRDAASGLATLGKVADACGDRWIDAGTSAVWEVDDAAAAVVELETLARELGGRSDPAETQVAGGRSVVVPPSRWGAFARAAAARGIAGINERADADAAGGCIRQRIEIRPRVSAR